MLKLAHPDNCESPVAVPSSALFGAEKYLLGSAMNRLLGLDNVFSNGQNPTNQINFARQIEAALSAQTRAIATLNSQGPAVNATLLNSVKAICNTLSVSLGPYKDFTSMPTDQLTRSERACYGAEAQIVREMGSPSALQALLNAFAFAGFDFSDVGVASSLIAWLSDKNSLHKKYELVQAQAKCSLWWKKMHDQGCLK